MSLTIDDLEAIKKIIKDVIVDAKLNPAAVSGEMQTKIDKMDDDLKFVKTDLEELKGSISQINSGQIPRQ